MRRFLIVLLLVTIVGAIAWWLLRWRSDTGPLADPWKALPPNSAVVLEVPLPLATWQRFITTTQLWRDLEKVPACATLNGLLLRMADAAANDERLQRTLATHPLLVAWEVAGDGPVLLAAWPMEGASGTLAPLGAALGIDLGPGSPLWNGGRLALPSDSTLPALELTWHNGLLLASDRSGMLDDAVKRLANGTVAPDSLLVRARATLGGGSDAHLLVQPARAERLFAAWTERDAAAWPEGWAALDLRTRPGAVLMSGLLFTAASDKGLDAILHGSPGRSDTYRTSILRVLPANVARLRTLRVDDALRYVQERTGTAPNEDLFNAYAAWVSGTIGLAEARQPGDSLTHRWGVLQAADPAKAAAALLARCTGGCDTTTYRGLRMARMEDSDALTALFGPLFKSLDRPLWTMMADKVVVAGTPADMRAAIDAWIDGTSLAVDPRAGEFFRRYASDASFSWWADVAHAFPLWKDRARPEAVQRLEAARGAWDGLGGCLLELAPQRPGVHEITFCLQHEGGERQEVGALWSAAIGAPLEGVPHLVKDHLSKTLQVLVQDRDHRISLISCTGKVLWQRELPAPILGDVRQVDRFKNGKLQLLFNTADAVFLIDRNGKDVEGFPIGLPGKAATALSVFDYEGTREYRVLVPLADGRLLNFGMDGKPVQGWAVGPLPAVAIAPIEHVRLKGKDFLLALDAAGGATALDRRGEQRYRPQLRMKGVQAVLGLRSAMDIGACRVAWSDSSGAVLSGTLDGAVDTLAHPGRGQVTAFDADGDGGIDVARVTSDSLLVTDAKGTRFGTTLPDGGTPQVFPVFLTGRTGEALGLVLPAQDQVRLFSGDGTRWPDLPVTGDVPFRVADINLDGVLELVTATKDGRVIAYALSAPWP